MRVPPEADARPQQSVREPGKSDPIDALAIARAALREGIDRLPVAFLDEQAHEIRVLNDYRDQLVNERVRLASRLRWHLVQIAPELEAQIRPQGLIGPRIRAKVARGLARLPRSPQVRVARAILKRINEIYREEAGLLAEIKALIEAHCPQLLAEHGCGTVSLDIGEAIPGPRCGARIWAKRGVARPFLRLVFALAAPAHGYARWSAITCRHRGTSPLAVDPEVRELRTMSGSSLVLQGCHPTVYPGAVCRISTAMRRS